MSTITVGTADLRRALLAVGPHASTDPDFTSIYRVRLSVGGENVMVTATNLYSAGLALVSVLEHDGELVDIDLSCQDVAEILALFRPAKKQGDEYDSTLALTATDEHFRVTDTSGLFPGKSLALPRYPVDDNFPNVRKLALQRMTRQKLEPAERLLATGSLLALFKSAAAAYGEPLALEMTGKNAALIVSCGESFIGLLSSSRPAEDAEALMAAWRTAWLYRLEQAELAAV